MISYATPARPTEKRSDFSGSDKPLYVGSTVLVPYGKSGRTLVEATGLYMWVHGPRALAGKAVGVSWKQRVTVGDKFRQISTYVEKEPQGGRVGDYIPVPDLIKKL